MPQLKGVHSGAALPSGLGSTDGSKGRQGVTKSVQFLVYVLSGDGQSAFSGLVAP
jgi:hypothetical protein